MPIHFFDRDEAGLQLAQRLSPFKGQQDAIVMGLPPGGVIVAAAVARALGLPLAAFLLSPVAAEGHTTRPIGMVSSGGVRILDQDAIRALQLPRRLIDEESEVAERELAALERLYHLDRPLPQLRDKTVILVDDAVGTGHTLVSAVRAMRQLGPHTIIASAPAMSSVAACHIAAVADRCIAVVIPPGEADPADSYVDFPPATDQQVLACLEGCDHPTGLAVSEAAGGNR